MSYCTTIYAFVRFLDDKLFCELVSFFGGTSLETVPVAEVRARITAPHLLRLLIFIGVILLPLAVTASSDSTAAATRSSQVTSEGASVVWRRPGPFQHDKVPVVAAGLVYLVHDYIEDSGKPELYALEAQTGNIKWKFSPDINGLERATSPVLAGDLILFGTWDESGSDLMYGQDEKVGAYLYAVDAKTGLERWHYRANATSITTPFVVGDTVYVSCSGSTVKDGSNAPTQDIMRALAIANGELRWGFPVAGALTSESPTFADGILYFAADSATESRPSYLYAVDTTNGKLNWEFPVASASISQSPSFADGILYFVTNSVVESQSGYLYAVDTVTHKELWRFTLDKGRHAWGPPQVGGGLVHIGNYGEKLQLLKGDASTNYVADGDHLYTLDAKTGAPVWDFAVGPSVDASPVYTSLYTLKPGMATSPTVYGDSVLLVIDTDLGAKNGLGNNIERYVVALDSATGQQRWRYKSESPPDPGVVRLTTVGDDVLVGVMNSNTLSALDAKTGLLRWQFQADESPVGYPVQAKDVVYVVDYEDALYAVHVLAP